MLKAFYLWLIIMILDPSRQKVNVTRMIIFSFIPILAIYAGWRIQKFWVLLRIRIVVGWGISMPIDHLILTDLMVTKMELVVNPKFLDQFSHKTYYESSWFVHTLTISCLALAKSCISKYYNLKIICELLLKWLWMKLKKLFSKNGF